MELEPPQRRVAIEEDVVGEHVADVGGAKDVGEAFAQFLCGGVVEDGRLEWAHVGLLLRRWFSCDRTKPAGSRRIGRSTESRRRASSVELLSRSRRENRWFARCARTARASYGRQASTTNHSWRTDEQRPSQRQDGEPDDGRRSSTRTTTPWRRSSPTTSCSTSVARTRWRATTRVSVGCSAVVGSWFEATNGQIELDQQFCIGDRRVGRRVGTRHAGPQRQDPRVPQRLRVPVRGRSDRRDVDVPRRAARRRPRRSSPDRRRRSARLGVDGASHRGRSSGVRRPTGGATPSGCVDVDLESARRRRSRPARDRGVPHRSRRGGLRPLGASPPDVLRRRRGAPGGVLRVRSSPRASGSRATSAAAEAGSTAPPGSWTTRASTASSRATSNTGWR